MSRSDKSPSLDDLLGYFPVISPPVSLTQESALHFSRENKPLSAAVTATFLSVLTDHDDEVEYIPCFQLVVHGSIVAIVYWKAILLQYDYVLVTIDKKRAKVLSQKVIGGTRLLDNRIFRAGSAIREDLEIELVVNEYDTNESELYPLSTQVYHIEIMADGQIISELDDSPLFL